MLSGRAVLEGGGKIELSVLWQGRAVFSQRIKREGITPFSCPLSLWGGEAYTLQLTVFPHTTGRLENLSLDYHALAEMEAPALLTYYRKVPVPPEVVSRNTMRYVEALHRDLQRLFKILSIGVIYLALIVACWLGARCLFKASKKGTDASRRRSLFRTLSFVLLMVCLILVLPLPIEMLYRFGVSLHHAEPVFLTYPFGFNLDDIYRTHYERENTYRFDTLENGIAVPHMSQGKERHYYGNHFYRASVNEGGFRGPLKPLPSEGKVILCIGGSSTYGLNDDGETYPDFLQAALDREKDGAYAVFNLGIPALTAAKFLGRVKGALRINPYLIVIYAGFNDLQIRPGDLYTLEQQLAQTHRLYGPAHYSLLCRNLLIGALAGDESRARHTEREMNRLVRCDAGFLVSKADEYAEKIDGVLDYARTVGARVLYVNEYALIGPRTSLDYLDKENSIQEALTKAYLPQYEQGLATLSLLHLRVQDLVSKKGYSHVTCLTPECFDDVEPRDILVDWVHLNRDGNRLLGDFVASKILPSRVESPVETHGNADLLVGDEWIFQPPVEIVPLEVGFEVRCPRSWSRISKAFSPKGRNKIRVQLTVEVNQPFIGLAVSVGNGTHSIAMSRDVTCIPKGEQRYSWDGDLGALGQNGTLYLELALSGTTAESRVIIRSVGVY
jgi:lysophospholipase L1-like esterase